MASLLSLPNETLINILIAAPTTRTLLRLSTVNGRMRAVWLEHSQHIIFSAYKKKIPHIQQAINLTLAEIECAEVSPPLTKGFYHAAHDLTRPPSPLGLCLPRVLRNAGLASSVCDAAVNDNTLQKMVWEMQDPRTEMLRRYYLIRHTLLAYDHFELRPSLLSALSACTEKMHDANKWLSFFLVAAASMTLRMSHGLLEKNPDFHGWDADTLETPLRMTDRWYVAQRVFTAAESQHYDKEMDPPSFDVSRWDVWDDPDWS